MIIQEQISDTLVRTYSDRGYYIFGGYPEAEYEESVDPISMNRTFIETDIPIQGADIEPGEAVKILLGRDDEE